MHSPFFNSPGIGGGGDSSSLAIDDNHFFDDNTARDAYFVTNADELETGVFISVGAGYQQYNGTSWVDKTAVVTGPTGTAGTAGTDGTDGDNAYVYVAYASADDGTDFTTTFDADLDYIAVKSTSTAIASPAAGDFSGLWKNYKGATGEKGETGETGSQGIQGPAGAAGAAGTDGDDGADAFVYIAYASANDGTDFTTTFNAALDYIAVLSTTTEISSPAVGDFAGLWKMYKGATGPAGDPGSGIVWKGAWNGTDTFDANDAVEHEGSSYVANAENTNKEPGVDASWDLWVEKGETGDQGLQGEQGEPGEAGADAYVYIAYASDGFGTGFTTAFDGDLDYIAIKNSLTEIAVPQASDFAGLWKMYKGAAGAAGAAGTDGDDGDDAYVYVAYASDASGTDFTMTFNAALEYIAIKSTTTEIVSPAVGDFTGLWTKYLGSDGADGTDANISDTAYDATSWDGVTDTAPTKNAVRDRLEQLPVYHGVQTIGTVSFSNANKTVDIADVTVYWYKGVRVATSTLSCDLDLTADRDHADATLTTNTLYYIYFKDATGKLYWSPTVWDLKEKVPVATVFWNGTAGAIHKEWHNHTRDLDWHINAHLTIGARYYSGLALTKPTNVFDAALDITTGYIYDEDLLFTITNPTTARAWYKASAGVYTFADISRPFTGAADDAPTFLDTDTYTLETFAANRYICYWVYGTGDIDRPIYIIPSHVAAAYTTATLARAETMPDLSSMGLNPEMKLLYRFIYLGNGQLQETTDYRFSSSLPIGAIPAPAAASVTFAPAGTIAATNVQSAIEELDTEIVRLPDSPSQGDVIYYNGSAWAKLAAGTNGYFLKTQGAGANPAWAEVAGGSTDIGLIIALGG